MLGWRRIVGLAALVVLGTGAAAATVIGVARARNGREWRSAGIVPVRYGVEIQAVYTAGGDPLLVANFSPDGSLATARWSICSRPPGSVCVPAGSHHGVLNPGPRPPGTMFRATARFPGRTYAAQVTWQGRVTALSRPRIRGYARAGARVVPIPATWRGGWGTEFDQLGVEACKTRSAHRCLMVSGGQLGCRDHSSGVVSRSIEGRYLFALDARSPADEACAGVGYGSQSEIPVWPITRTVVRSAPRGPVTKR
jgi:hypothetical protein